VFILQLASVLFIQLHIGFKNPRIRLLINHISDRVSCIFEVPCDYLLHINIEFLET